MSEVVRWETEDQIGVITLNRPERLNALDREALEALQEILDSRAASGDVRAVIITGSGDRAFAAGADLASMKDMDRGEAEEWSLLGQRVFSSIEDLPRPVIAAINGF
ncbi:MAG: enoyl-CoA hydratase-related protein, partial [Bacillota bacterium]